MTFDELRAQIRRDIAAIVPLDAIEADAQASVLAWIASGASLFREHGPIPPRHLAVYFALVDQQNRLLLQVDHIKAGAWVLPGGHIDTELPAVAVVREAREELSIDASFHPLFGDRPLLVTESRTRPPDEHVDITLWHVLAGSQDMALTSDETEFRGLRWVSIDRVGDWVETCYAPQQVSRFVAKLSRRLDAVATPA